MLVLTVLIGTSITMMSWWNRRAPGFVRNGRVAKADGARFGRTATAARCVDQVLERFARTPPDPSSVATERLFLQSCLAVTVPSPEACAPVAGAAPPGTDWLAHVCAARQPADSTCPALLRPLATYCATGNHGTSPQK
jgi:hypothetical protein